MSEPRLETSAITGQPAGPGDNASLPDEVPSVDEQVNHSRQERRDDRRWWIKLLVQPLLFLACGSSLFIGLGIAQRYGLISSSGQEGPRASAKTEAGTLYICPMMCTPPSTEPGRCPVCAMELVPVATNTVKADSRSVQIDPAARRVANIQTVAAVSMPMMQSIETIGELSYDEGNLKTISAYVDGRLERLYADYTGVVVKEGDDLALVYSPRLYSGQVELLLAKKSREDEKSSTPKHAIASGFDMYQSAKQRLIEQGMTESQILQLEKAGVANSRMHLSAPISGTVIEKFAVEGEYVKEGQPIYRLADLSTLWLMLELFPEDAAAIRYGQKVEAEVQSLPGQVFTGRVAFVDPTVNQKTRTVGVRVVVRNEAGLLRVGDYATAQIRVPPANQRNLPIFDPELANKWISPRHPHIVSDSPGQCPLCGIDLVAAEQFGFTDQPNTESSQLVIPRDAVLMAGSTSVVYVETEPGRFEIRRVVLGPEFGDQIVILQGVAEGEQVATRGNFLVDSQMQLTGNPSLIDPNKAEPKSGTEPNREVIAALTALSPDDRKLAESQRICPVTMTPLGSMGIPLKVDVRGTPVFICCEGCRKRLQKEPDKYLAILASSTSDGSPKTRGGQLGLPPIGPLEALEPEPPASRSEESGVGLPPIATPRLIAEPAVDASEDDESGETPGNLPVEVNP